MVVQDQSKVLKTKVSQPSSATNSVFDFLLKKVLILLFLIYFILTVDFSKQGQEQSSWIVFLRFIVVGCLVTKFFTRYLHFSFTKRVSQFTALITRIYIPVIFRNFVYSTFAHQYGVNVKDMVKPYKGYANFNEFFTRKVKNRLITPNPNIVLASADSKILSVSKIRSNDCLLVKGVSYNLGHFITGYKNYEIDQQELSSHYRLHQESTVWSCILYLAPGDYHRYHSPVDFLALRRTHILGTLAPVKESYISKHPGVYEGNERVVLQGEWSEGFMILIFVGATNVGSMTLNFDPLLNTNQVISNPSYVNKSQEYNREKFSCKVPGPFIQRENGIMIPKGAELGKFNMGSTVVMVFESKRQLQWKVKQGEKVRYGQPICHIMDLEE